MSSSVQSVGEDNKMIRRGPESRDVAGSKQTGRKASSDAGLEGNEASSYARR